VPTGVVLITGGGRGIGAAIARHAAAEGYIPVVTYKSRADEAARLVETIRASGGHALAVQSDASREDEIVRAFEAADAVGTLVGLVNNAGATGGSGRSSSRPPSVPTRWARSCAHARRCGAWRARAAARAARS
jgi:NAD(P)-dependent dehydrogenase (short-subunit alcohol dehydrogenase family)